MSGTNPSKGNNVVLMAEWGRRLHPGQQPLPEVVLKDTPELFDYLTSIGLSLIQLKPDDFNKGHFNALVSGSKDDPKWTLVSCEYEKDFPLSILHVSLDRDGSLKIETKVRQADDNEIEFNAQIQDLSHVTLREARGLVFNWAVLASGHCEWLSRRVDDLLAREKARKITLLPPHPPADALGLSSVR